MMQTYSLEELTNKSPIKWKNCELNKILGCLPVSPSEYLWLAGGSIRKTLEGVL